MSIIIIASIITFILSILCTYLLSRWAKRRGFFMPKIRARDVHTKKVPRVGGLAIVSVFTITIIVINYIYPELFSSFNFPFKILGVSIDKRLLGVLVGGIVLVAVMAIDDFRGLKPWTKLLWQIVVWAIIVACGIGLTYFNNPFGLVINLNSIETSIQLGAAVYHIVWVADIILLLWMLLMMNAVNFIDGADGLAGGIGTVGFLVIGVLSLMPTVNQPAVAMLAFVAAAATLGFLLFNYYPAKVFLGDAGAMWIGFMLAILSVISGGKMAALFLVLAVVIIDGLIVVIDRVRRGKNPLTSPDQTHIHHRFMDAGFSMPWSVAIIIGISAIFGLLALITNGQIKWILIAVLTVLTIISLVLLRRFGGRRREERI